MTGLWQAFIALSYWHVFSANYLSTVYIWTSWITLKNTVSCQIGNIHSGKNHSCETQLVTVINDWARILDKGGQTDTFILDFEKAFGTPPHELLKCKLFENGIMGNTLLWTDSFLCSRQQRVVVNGAWSKWAPVFVSCTTGPLSLGLLLFSLHINDIMDGIDSSVCRWLCLLSDSWLSGYSKTLKWHWLLG